MIRRMADRGSSIGVVIDEYIPDISFCPDCQKNKVISKLKDLVYLDDNGKALPPQPDADEFKRCYKCGLVVPVREAKKQGKLSGIQGIDIVQNPYDVGKGIVLGTDSRLTSRIKNLKRRQTKHPDAEVQKLIEQGYEVISYQQDIPT
jgi:hypothetical protein